jgi:hypothetical protein
MPKRISKKTKTTKRSLDECNASPTSVIMNVTAAVATSTDDKTTASWDGDSILGAKTTLVRFAPLVKVYDVPFIRRKEAELRWYSNADYDHIEDQCENLLRKLEKGIRVNPRKHTFQGLESWTKDGNRKRMVHRSESLQAVVSEQFAQWEEGLEDHDFIAEMYTTVSKHARMVALARGLMIEREVQEIFAEAVVESPSFLSILTAIRRSPYIEKVLYMTRTKSSCYTAMKIRTSSSRKPRSKHSPSSKKKDKVVVTRPESVSSKSPTRPISPSRSLTTRRRRSLSTSPTSSKISPKKNKRDKKQIELVSLFNF